MNSEATRRSVEVKEWKLDYSLKKQPVIAVGKRRRANNKLKYARVLALHELNQLRVTVAYMFLHSRDSSSLILDKTYSRSIGIAVTEDHVLITDSDPIL
ncbi:hypothetical protein LOD99_10080 [Oopsacas minuta]|uniref:Uncharacterized protein n=1 Tax=Oopsacas minuta TaxID=111878 RepID=A0AAV7KJ98_9METZ|nr:hypothetical protein LOD99_10080 [Oopsacas minuta]